MTSALSPSPPSPPSSPPSSPPHTSSHMSPYFSPPGDGSVFSSRDSAVRVVSLAPVSDRQSNPTSTSSRNRNSNRNGTDDRNENGDGNSRSVYGLDDDAYGIGMDVFSVSYSTEGQGEGEKGGEVHPRPSPSSFPCPPHRSISGNVSQNVSQNINHSGSVSQNMSFVSVMSTPDNSQTNPMRPGTTLHTSQSQLHSVSWKKNAESVFCIIYADCWAVSDSLLCYLTFVNFLLVVVHVQIHIFTHFINSKILLFLIRIQYQIGRHRPWISIP